MFYDRQEILDVRQKHSKFETVFFPDSLMRRFQVVHRCLSRVSVALSKGFVLNHRLRQHCPLS